MTSPSTPVPENLIAIARPGATEEETFLAQIARGAQLPGADTRWQDRIAEADHASDPADARRQVLIAICAENAAWISRILFEEFHHQAETPTPITAAEWNALVAHGHPLLVGPFAPGAPLDGHLVAQPDPDTSPAPTSDEPRPPAAPESSPTPATLDDSPAESESPLPVASSVAPEPVPDQGDEYRVEHVPVAGTEVDPTPVAVHPTLWSRIADLITTLEHDVGAGIHESIDGLIALKDHMLHRPHEAP